MKSIQINSAIFPKVMQIIVGKPQSIIKSGSFSTGLFTSMLFFDCGFPTIICITLGNIAEWSKE